MTPEAQPKRNQRSTLNGQVIHRRADLVRRLAGPAAFPVVGVNPQRHLRGAVTKEILDLLDVHARLKELRGVGVSELVRMAPEVQGDLDGAIPAAGNRASKFSPLPDCADLDVILSILLDTFSSRNFYAACSSKS